MPKVQTIAEDDSVRGYANLDKLLSDLKNQRNMQALKLCFFAQEPV